MTRTFSFNVIFSSELSSGLTSFQKRRVVPRRSKNALMLNAVARVAKSGYQYAFVVNCAKEKPAGPNSTLPTIDSSIHFTEGSLVFHNPHGYLPGGWYLKLPFSSIIGFGYLCALLVYLVKCGTHFEQTTFVHYGVVVVLLMGLLEQGVYFTTFMGINSSGELPCCPVSTEMTLCMVSSAIKRATLVCFLLLVSMGYGIQRPALKGWEWTAVITIGVAYLAASVLYEISLVSDIDSEASGTYSLLSSTFCSLIVSVLNTVVIYWIYFSVVYVIESLEESKEMAKKGMYESLIRSVMLWFVFGVIAEAVFYSWLTHKISTPWKYDMVPKFLWDFLFFFIVLQLGWLWMPTRRSKEYAYAQQLPTEDFDDLEMVETEEDDEVSIRRNKFQIEHDDGEESDESEI